jgi:hypothetical protein
MRREPSLTFEGALRILGRHESRLIGKLDTVLGGVILTAGIGLGAAAVGGPTLAPAAMLAAVWGFTEQKNEAVSLLRKAISAVSGKLAGAQGYERRQLIAAAHTAIVVAAFFESLQEHVGKELFGRLKITDAEKETLIAHRLKSDKTVYDVLYAAEIPAPSPAHGFEENVNRIEAWYTGFANDLDSFLHGLSAGEDASFQWHAIINGAVERYRSHFLTLAAKVPEFMIWALLGESAATRANVVGLRADIAAALDARRDALGRVEALLTLDAAREGAIPDLRAAVARANSGVLEQQVIPEDTQGYGSDITFPTTGNIYISPRYRVARPDDRARPSDDSYWDDQPSRDDFDLMLAGYVSSPDATRLPMLLLGHPGAGKSILTKVFAARLPASAFTVVRVPLRRVGANAPLLDQIEQALAQSTNRRVESWWQLADQSEGTVRVVLLDGLDELLQATRNDRSGYLQEAMEFQRLEIEQQRPVVIVVTSRTVVADRVDVPRGTTIVKLDSFDDSDIEEWLSRWRRANATAIASEKIRELTADCVTGGDAAGNQRDQAAGRLGGGVRELARQPLLLLMLAIYTADPALPPLNADMATADLYRRLIESFARREAAKEVNNGLHSEELEGRVRDHLSRLEVAALAMFNRGRQDIGEEELGVDLVALDPNPRPMERSLSVEAGQRVIGEFFFVHAAEARPLTGPGEPEAEPGRLFSHRDAPRRSYEFLHATFGEYLVASRIMNELTEVTAKSFAGRRGPTDPDDDLLYALLSQQPLAARKSTLTFAQEIFGGMLREDRTTALQVLEVLEMLLGRYRYRHGSDRYAGYRPIPPDRLHELACYSANLITLRVMLEPDGNSIPLVKLLRAQDGTLEQWRSTVVSWKAGLNADGLQSVLATIELSGDPLGVAVNPDEDRVAVFDRGDRRQSGVNEIDLARLVGDKMMEERLRYGSVIIDGYAYSYGEGDWVNVMASWLIPAISGKITPSIIRPASGDVPDKDIRIIADLIFSYLRILNSNRTMSTELLRLLFDLPQVFQIDHETLAAVVVSDAALLDEIPELRNPEVYGGFAVFIEEFFPEPTKEALSEEAVARERDILEQLIKRRVPWDFENDDES